MDASHLYSSRVYPPKSPEQASAADSFLGFLDPVALLAVHPVSYSPTSDLPRDSTTPRRFPAGVLQTVFLGRARGKQSVNALFQTVTRLRDRACLGWTAVDEIVKEFAQNVKQSVESRAGGWSVPDWATQLHEAS